MGSLDGGVELPREEFRVEDDFCVGTVVLDSADESDIRKLARDRRRSSLKKGILYWNAGCTSSI